VQGGQDHFKRGLVLTFHDVHRDAAAVVLDAGAAVGVHLHRDAVGVAGHHLVDRVVDDLIHQVVQSRLAGRTDVHRRPVAHTFEALEHLNVFAGVRIGPVGGLDFFAGVTGSFLSQLANLVALPYLLILRGNNTC
jgi:hypothetical protein